MFELVRYGVTSTSGLVPPPRIPHLSLGCLLQIDASLRERVTQEILAAGALSSSALATTKLVPHTLFAGCIMAIRSPQLLAQFANFKKTSAFRRLVREVRTCLLCACVCDVSRLLSGCDLLLPVDVLQARPLEAWSSSSQTGRKQSTARKFGHFKVERHSRCDAARVAG